MEVKPGRIISLVFYMRSNQLIQVHKVADRFVSVHLLCDHVMMPASARSCLMTDQ